MKDYLESWHLEFDILNFTVNNGNVLTVVSFTQKFVKNQVKHLQCFGLYGWFQQFKRFKEFKFNNDDTSRRIQHVDWTSIRHANVKLRYLILLYTIIILLLFLKAFIIHLYENWMYLNWMSIRFPRVILYTLNLRPVSRGYKNIQTFFSVDIFCELWIGLYSLGSYPVVETYSKLMII